MISLIHGTTTVIHGLGEVDLYPSYIHQTGDLQILIQIGTYHVGPYISAVFESLKGELCV